MARLEDLPIVSLSKLPRSEALEKILAIRERRRTVPPQALREKKGKKVLSTPESKLKKMFAKMSNAQKQQLLLALLKGTQ